MMARRVLLSLLLSLLPALAWGQGVNAVHPVKPNGTALFPSAFASADNIAAQTSTALHGFMFVWDSGGSNWDRWTGAVSQSGTWTVQPGNTANTTPWLTKIHDGTLFATVRDTGSSDSLNVAIVDGSGNQITSFGGGTQYTEDVASAADPVGTQLIARRRDTLSAETTTDGDNTAVNATSKGELYVKHTDPITVTDGSGALNVICDSGCGGAASFEDNDAFTFNTTAVNNMGAVVDDTATNTITENSAGAVRMNTNRILYTQPTGSTGTALHSAPVALGDDTSNPTVGAVGVYIMCFDGTTWDRCRGTTIDSDDNSIASAQSSSLVVNENYVFDGTNWTRQLAAANALNSTGAGISTAQIVGQFDDTAPTAITENQFGNLRMSANRNLFNTIRDAAGNERGANVNASNAVLVAQTGELPAGTQNIGDVDIASLPNEGQQTMANSISVAIASDQSTLNVIGTLADDGNAAATNRLPTMPAIAQSGFNSATSGRNTALNTLSGTGAALVAAMPDMSLESYSASAVVSSASSATDISVLPGNANNTVLVTEVRVSCTQTTAGNVELHIIKRGSADSGGTSSGMTEVPDDANYSAADSALLTYTANPTINGTVGDIDIVKLGCMATGTTVPNDLYIGNFRQKPIVLRGTAQQLAVNLNSATVSGGSFAITWKWIEASGL